jgi:hypothetical protein
MYAMMLELAPAAGNAPIVTNPAKAVIAVARHDRKRPRGLIVGNLAVLPAGVGRFAVVRPIFLAFRLH